MYEICSGTYILIFFLLFIEQIFCFSLIQFKTLNDLELPH